MSELSQKRTNRIASTILIATTFLVILNSIRTIENEKYIYNIHIVTAASYIVSFILLSFSQLKAKIKYDRLFFIIINIFCFSITISSVYSYEPETTLIRSIQLFIILNTLFFSINIIQNPIRTFKIITLAILSLTLFSGLYSILLLQFGNNTILSNEITINSLAIGEFTFRQQLISNRPASFLDNPNTLGALVMYSLLGIYFLIDSTKNIKYKIISLFIIPLLFYILYITGSRASILAVTVGSLAFIILRFLSGNKKHLILALSVSLSVFIFLASIFYLNSDYYINLINNILNRKSSLLSGREVAWNILWDSIKLNPWLGVGYKMSNDYLLTPQGFEPYGSHNIYLSIFAELGVFGLISFLLLFLYPTFKVIRNLKLLPKKYKKLAFECIAISFSFLTHQIFEDSSLAFSILFVFPLINIMFCNKLADLGKT